MSLQVSYVTIDPVTEGPGRSQVVRYVEGLAGRGVDVRLTSFERDDDDALRDRLEAAGVEWRALRFGRLGPVGGLGRVARAARAARGDRLVHARSDLAAAGALLGHADRWVWDMRAFFADQRIELGALRAGSPEERALRWVERASARGADAIVVLAHAAIDVVRERHGDDAADRCVVIPTCADLDLFAPSPMPAGDVLRVLLAGSLNAYYDVPAMLALVDRLRQRRATRFTVLAPAGSPFDADLDRAADRRDVVPASSMPGEVAACHVGLSVCRADAGVSLRAAMPTKLGELLAGGRPVVVNPGLGDMDSLLTAHRCGVVLDGTDPDALDAAADEIERLVDDPGTPARCRRAAEEAFDVERGIDRLVELYRGIR